MKSIKFTALFVIFSFAAFSSTKDIQHHEATVDESVGLSLDHNAHFYLGENIVTNIRKCFNNFCTTIKYVITEDKLNDIYNAIKIAGSEFLAKKSLSTIAQLFAGYFGIDESTFQGTGTAISMTIDELFKRYPDEIRKFLSLAKTNIEGLKKAVEKEMEYIRA